MAVNTLLSYGFTLKRHPKPPLVKPPPKCCCCHHHGHLRQTSLCELGYVPSEHLDHNIKACPVYCGPAHGADNDDFDGDSNDDDDGNGEDHQPHKRSPCPHCTQLQEERERECLAIDKHMSTFFALLKRDWHEREDPFVRYPFGYLPIDHYIVSMFETARAGIKGLKNLRQPTKSSDIIRVAPPAARATLEGLPAELKHLITEALLENPQPSSLIALQCLITVSNDFYAVIQSFSGQRLVGKYKRELKYHIAASWLKEGYLSRKKYFDEWCLNGPLKSRSFIPRDLFTTENQDMDYTDWSVRIVRTWYGDAKDEESQEASNDECYDLFFQFIEHARWWCVMCEEGFLDDADRFKATNQETRNVKGFRKTLPRFIVEALSEVICFQDHNHLWGDWRTLHIEEDLNIPQSNIKKQPRTLLVVIDEEACENSEVLLLYLNAFGQIIPSLTRNIEPGDFHKDFFPSRNLLSSTEIEELQEQMLEDLAEMEFDESEYGGPPSDWPSDATDGW